MTLTDQPDLPDDNIPFFDGFGALEGDTLLIPRGQGAVEVRAPEKYLRKLFDWCQGKRTMADLRTLSVQTWDNDEFVDFVSELVNAGVLTTRAALPKSPEGMDHPGLVNLEPASSPSLEIKRWNVLDRTTFHLIQAKIDWGGGHTSQGWGRADKAALAHDKAVAEAVERYAYRSSAQYHAACCDQLDHWIKPETIVSYRPLQYRQKGFLYRPFSAQEPRLWMRGRSQNGEDAIWILADCVLHPGAFPEDYRSRLYTHATSSGCASAPTLEQAILNATIELVERDAFMRHWFAQCGGYLVPLKTLPERFRSRLDLLVRSGCVVQVQCLHLGRFPVWLVIAQHAGLHFTCIGTSSGLNAETALESALSELETHAHARLDGVPAVRIRVADVKSPTDHGTLYAMKRFFRKADALMTCTAPKSYSKILPYFSVTAEQLFRHLEKAGNRPVWIDLSVQNTPKTLAGAALNTVRVIAPGLIPIAFGTGNMPLGMDLYGHPASRCPHPFI